MRLGSHQVEFIALGTCIAEIACSASLDAGMTLGTADGLSSAHTISTQAKHKSSFTKPSSKIVNARLLVTFPTKHRRLKVQLSLETISTNCMKADRSGSHAERVDQAGRIGFGNKTDQVGQGFCGNRHWAFPNLLARILKFVAWKPCQQASRPLSSLFNECVPGSIRRREVAGKWLV